MLQTPVDLANVRIETERLLLVSISMRDKEDCFREFTEEITAFMNPAPPKEIGDTERFIADSMQGMDHGSELVCAILIKGTNEFLGCAGLHEIQTSTPELGVWIKKSAHGRKYGQEAMRGLQVWAHEHLTYSHLVYPVAADNLSSRKVAEALGGRVTREYVHTTLQGKALSFVDYWIERSS